MATGDGFRSRLAVGLAQYLAGVVPGAEWRPTGPAYPAGFSGVALFVGEWPAQPDRAVAVTVYLAGGAEDDQVAPRVQLRSRWAGQDPRGVMDLSDALQDELDERTLLRLPTGITIGRSTLISSASLGQDSAKRWSWTDNYELTADRPRD